MLMMVVVMISIIMMMVMGVLIVIPTIFFRGHDMMMKLWSLVKQWLDKSLPIFFLFNKAFDFDFIVNIILDVTGQSSLDNDLDLALRNDIGSRPQISLENDGFLIDA